MKKGFLIDMDGVIYRGSRRIPGASDFVNALQERQVPFLLLTNNSQRTRRDVATKLHRMGFNIRDEQVFTCAMATARFVARQKPNGTAYVIGEGGLLQALHVNGYSIVDNHPDYVVVGEGRTFNMESIEAAVNMILGGAKLIATNLDPNCPTSSGTRPGCGAIIRMLEEATGARAFSVGKPSPVIMREARKALGLRTEEITMIGDTIETDVLGGIQVGYRTILVETGVNSGKDLKHFAYQPDQVVPSISHLHAELFGAPVQQGSDSAEPSPVVG